MGCGERGDGGAQERPLNHRFGEGFEEDGEVGKFLELRGSRNGWAGGSGEDRGGVYCQGGLGHRGREVVCWDVRVECGHHCMDSREVQCCRVSGESQNGYLRVSRWTHPKWGISKL